MRQLNYKIKIMLILICTFGIIFGVVLNHISKTEFAVADSTNSINIASSCATCKIGDTVAVTVSATAVNTPIGAVEINLNYDQTRLKYVSLSHFSGGDDFSDILLERVEENVGVIHVEAGKQGGLLNATGNIFVASFTASTAGSAAFSASPIDGANQDGRITLSANTLNIMVEEKSSSGGGDDTGGSAVDTGDTGGTGDTGASSSVNTGTSSKTKVAYTSSIPLYSKSEVVFDKTTAEANGSEKLCASIKVKKYSTIVTSIKPTLKTEGGLDLSDPTLNGKTWQVCATSTVAGDKRIMISVANYLVKDQTVSFTSLPAEQNLATTIASIASDGEVKTPTDLVRKLLLVEGNVSVAKKNDFFNRKQITDIDLIKISGRSYSNTKIDLYIHSTEAVQQTVTADENGQWSVNLVQALAAGNHRVEVAVIDKYGNESESMKISNFEVVQSNSKIMWIYIISGVSIIGIFAFLFVQIKNRRNKRVLDTSDMLQNNVNASNPTL